MNAGGNQTGKAKTDRSLSEEGIVSLSAERLNAEGGAEEISVQKQACGLAEFMSVRGGSFSFHFSRKEQPAAVILHVARGTVFFTLRAATRKLGPGSVAVIAADSGVKFLARGNVSLNVIAAEQRFFHAECGYRAAGFRPLFIEPTTALRKACGKAFTFASSQAASLGEEASEELIRSVFCYLRPVFTEEMKMHPVIMNRKNRLRFEAIRYIREHFREADLTAGRIAETAGVSERYLGSVFAESGSTLMETVQQLRLESAAAELRELRYGDLPVAEIGKRNGYPGPEHFSRLFRKTFGVTPKEWRNRREGSASPEE